MIFNAIALHGAYRPQDIHEISRQDVPMILISEDTSGTFAKEAQRFGFALLADPVGPKVLRELLGNR